MKNIFTFIIYLWQLPQLIAALIFQLFIKVKREMIFKKIKIRYIENIKEFGISFGPIIYLSDDKRGKELINHEYGHSRQSLLLGIFYPLIIGLPSIIRFFIYNKKMKTSSSKQEKIEYNKKYFSSFPENWADKLGNVDIEKREKFNKE